MFNNNDDDVVGKKALAEEENRRFLSQIIVLEALKEPSDKGTHQYSIDEIAHKIGKNEADVQRSLYILEGHKYVSPFPEGDFTSKLWKITDHGQEALKNQKVAHMTSFL